MKKRSRRNPYAALVALFFAGLLVFPQGLGSETLTMSTSYPAPMGIYKTIMTTGGTVASPANTLLNRDAGEVGIGTGNPQAALDVESTSASYPAARIVSSGYNGLDAESTGSGLWGATIYSSNGNALYAQSDLNNLWAGYFVGAAGYGVYGEANQAGAYAGFFRSWAGNSLVGEAHYAANWGAVLNNLSGYGVVSYSAGSFDAGWFQNGGGGGTAIRLATSGWSFYGYEDGHLDGDMWVNGVYHGNGSGLSFVSDMRLKDNIRPIADPLHKVLALDPVSFQWKKGSEERAVTKGTDFGFVAQEVEKVIPEAVGELNTAKQGKDTLESKLGTVKSLTYNRFIPFLTGAIQQFYREFTEEKGQLEALRAENKRLNERVSSLEARLDKLTKAGTVASLSKGDR